MWTALQTCCFGRKGTWSRSWGALLTKEGLSVIGTRAWPTVPQGPSHRPSLQAAGKLGHRVGVLAELRLAGYSGPGHPSSTCRKLTGPAALAGCPSSCPTYGSPGRSKSLARATPGQSRLGVSREPTCSRCPQLQLLLQPSDSEEAEEAAARRDPQAQPGYGNHTGRPHRHRRGCLHLVPARISDVALSIFARTELAQEGVAALGGLAGSPA